MLQVLVCALLVATGAVLPTTFELRLDPQGVAETGLRASKAYMIIYYLLVRSCILFLLPFMTMFILNYRLLRSLMRRVRNLRVRCETSSAMQSRCHRQQTNTLATARGVATFYFEGRPIAKKIDHHSSIYRLLIFLMIFSNNFGI